MDKNSLSAKLKNIVKKMSSYTNQSLLNRYIKSTTPSVDRNHQTTDVNDDTQPGRVSPPANFLGMKSREGSLEGGAASSGTNTQQQTFVNRASLGRNSIGGNHRTSPIGGLRTRSPEVHSDTHLVHRFEDMMDLCRSHTAAKAAANGGLGGNTAVKFARYVSVAVRKLTGQTLERYENIRDAVFERIAEFGDIDESDAATRVDRTKANLGQTGDEIISQLKNMLITKLPVAVGIFKPEQMKYKGKDQSMPEFVDRIISNAVSKERAASCISSSFVQNDNFATVVASLINEIKSRNSEQYEPFKPIVNLIEKTVVNMEVSDKILSDLFFIYLSAYSKSVDNRPKNGVAVRGKETFYVLDIPRNNTSWGALLASGLMQLHDKNYASILSARPELLKQYGVSKEDTERVIVRLGDVQTLVNFMLTKKVDSNGKKAKPDQVSQPVENLYVLVCRKLVKDAIPAKKPTVRGTSASREYAQALLGLSQ